MNDVDDEYSARKKNDKKTDDDEKSFSFNRTEDFWAFDKKNETTIKSNAFVNPQRQQQEQEQRQHHQTDKPKPKKHVDASKMMIMSKRASLDVGASKKGTAAASTAAKKGGDEELETAMQAIRWRPQRRQRARLVRSIHACIGAKRHDLIAND